MTQGDAGEWCGATLVICPVVAVIQWRQEIEKYTTPGALRVAVYHGAKRTSDPASLMQADVVLTTYSTIENDFRKARNPTKVTPPPCGNHRIGHELAMHNIGLLSVHRIDVHNIVRQKILTATHSAAAHESAHGT